MTEPGCNEQCDEGVENGTAGSCCTSVCTLKTGGTQCRAQPRQAPHPLVPVRFEVTPRPEPPVDDAAGPLLAVLSGRRQPTRVLGWIILQYDGNDAGYAITPIPTPPNLPPRFRLDKITLP